MHRKKSSTIANAGNDTTTVLPSNAITLDGGSTDPENNITSYRWVKISGPFAFSISNVNAVQTQVSTLVQGIYLFELKVTDAGGLSSKDTIQVTVISPSTTSCGDTNRPHVNARLIPVGTVSQARYGMAVASAGNKILFAGGSFGGVLSSRVDMYDITTQSCSTAELSEARSDISAIQLAIRYFLAGARLVMEPLQQRLLTFTMLLQIHGLLLH